MEIVKPVRDAEQGVESVSLEVGTVGFLPVRSGSFSSGHAIVVTGRDDSSQVVVGGGVTEGLASSRKKKNEDDVELCKGDFGSKWEVVSRAGIKAWKVKNINPWLPSVGI
jgi:hypothetical protein